MENMSRTLAKARSTDGTLIAYEQWGDGPPVVLVGGPLSTAATDAPLAGLLSDRFRVLTYDRRGRAASGDRSGHTVEREIEDLAAVIEEAGEAVCVHGTSSGGALALRAAAAGVPIAQLSLYEPPFLPSVRAGQRPPEQVRRILGLLASGRRGDALAVFLNGAGMPEQTVARVRGSAHWEVLESVAHTLPYDHRVTGNGSVPTALLRRVGIRVMVVDGGASPTATREAARLVALALPRGRHRTLTGQTHEVAPHVLAPLVGDFFAA
ncbi:alpha/beta fold hydrolase [Streptomyces clavuligerus]|uniref:Alpha/beta hydrolase n=1 Tax=Streptomyces clavuligerus TaxID=1901 RepID=E2Q7V6_STRCL|nr:alpha/beta hydrolase [Streptomyces clavuligerus]ANW17947.1 hydrolase [Streptomyces clavuligerus]AXU12505.1 alpha/beta hydrolase [Streptomyces clavuligerus]EFG09488.1 Alpha/beta hydrolase [Streptomyces clavuligerus]MBY6302401.1 alpha/beta fold hydrolase [Streptomyces clavuligerus]QCS05287.1 alpha/beta hydrolase [Streptomyces clavuligerus]